ncbi:UPF0029-domain-containing protein [Lepidopterella palustris CBS 459.81]|uniref:UPF0029-domain-containing protein n=1 Tax=Lepidopterella palustris CBS 459.81 TaxID=1314670 RepID=A0A8E2JHF8_9PEZI|nr:UPF0029-domain-containing protein [Lepidopterella palustris CBS 459.81]
MNLSLTEEHEAINSIFEPSTLSPISEDPIICALRLPSLPSVSLRIEFPADYPDAPPSILGTQTVGDDVQKGVGKQVVDVVRDVLAQVYKPGEPCIFDLIEEVRETLERAEEHGGITLHDHAHEQDRNAPADDAEDMPNNAGADGTATEGIIEESPPWTVAPPITEKKSIFLARCAPVSSPAQAKSYLAHLLATDKKAARATHNITAWRIRGAADTGTTYQDCDDDGETAAGGRILHLMQLMDVWDVMVVVTRWYGGVLLGPDRFRIINGAAREVLVLGGYVEEKEGKKKGKR